GTFGAYRSGNHGEIRYHLSGLSHLVVRSAHAGMVVPGGIRSVRQDDHSVFLPRGQLEWREQSEPSGLAGGGRNGADQRRAFDQRQSRERRGKRSKIVGGFRRTQISKHLQLKKGSMDDEQFYL